MRCGCSASRIESWEFIGRTLEELPRLRRPLRRYLLLYNAALFAGGKSSTKPRCSFRTRRFAKRPRPVAGRADRGDDSARRWRNVRRGELARARADFDRAAQQLAATPADAFRSYMTAELEIVRAQLGDGDDASVAETCRSAIGFFSQTDPGRVPGLFCCSRARRKRACLPRPPRPRSDPASSIWRAQQAGLGDEALQNFLLRRIVGALPGHGLAAGRGQGLRRRRSSMPSARARGRCSPRHRDPTRRAPDGCQTSRRNCPRPWCCFITRRSPIAS